MELDGKGAVNFEQLKDLIRKECDKWDRCYAHLEDKYKKLEHQVTNQDQQKTWQRGADNQQAMDQAPQRKTNLTKGKLQTNEAIAQEAYPQTTQVKQTEKLPKTQDEPSKATAVQGQKTKTNLHCPRKTNPIGSSTMLLAGKKPTPKQQQKNYYHSSVSPLTKIYPHDTMLPSLLPPHQHGTTSHDHPTSHSMTSQKNINPKKTCGHYWDLD